MVESVKVLGLEKFNEISVDGWKSRCSLVEKIENESMVTGLKAIQ